MEPGVPVLTKSHTCTSSYSRLHFPRAASNLRALIRVTDFSVLNQVSIVLDRYRIPRGIRPPSRKIPQPRHAAEVPKRSPHNIH